MTTSTNPDPRSRCTYAHEDNDGYITIRTKMGRRPQHRAVAESHFGRRIRFNEIVHHWNAVTGDNDSRNLVIMDEGKHIALHCRGYWYVDYRDGLAHYVPPNGQRRKFWKHSRPNGFFELKALR